MDYGKAFRIIRAAFGLRQAELAQLLRIGPSHVSLIEAGKRQPSHETIDDLADALRIPKSLIILLASEPKDLEDQDNKTIGALAVSLLKLLVSASEDAPQPTLPFSDPKKKEE